MHIFSRELLERFMSAWLYLLLSKDSFWNTFGAWCLKELKAPLNMVLLGFETNEPNSPFDILSADLARLRRLAIF